MKVPMAATDSVMKPHKGAVLSLAYAPDGKRLVTTGSDNKLLLTDVAQGGSTELGMEQRG